MPANLDQRFGWVRHAVRFLYLLGHQGETIIGVWKGQESIPALDAFCRQVSPHIRIVRQDGEARNTKRLLDLAEMSHGEYLVTQGDDDLLFPSGLHYARELLRNDLAIACTQGRFIQLHLDRPQRPGEYFIFPFPVWQALENHPLERLENFVNNVSMTWHALYRRGFFIERMAAMNDLYHQDMTRDDALFETLGDLYAAVKGKFVVFNEMYMFRGKHQTQGSRTFSSGNHMREFPHLILADNFSASYKVLQGKIADLLASLGVDVQTADERIMNAHVKLLERVLNGKRGELEPDEAAWQAMLRQQPMHPALVEALSAVHATRP